MAIYECKCKGCGAEFFAVLENEKETFECPACSKSEIDRKLTDIPESSCGGSCGGCSKGCN